MKQPVDLPLIAAGRKREHPQSAGSPKTDSRFILATSNSLRTRLPDLEHVVDEVFEHLVEQAALRGLLALNYSIDWTDVKTMPAGRDASKRHDSTAEEYYCGCTVVSTDSTIPILAELTEGK